MEARNLSEALKLIMAQRGCSGSQLARDLGVSQSWLSYAARGKKDTSTGNAARLLASVGWELVIRPKTEDDDPMKRREFMTAAASVMFVPSPKVGPDQDPAYVRELARTVARARYEHGSGTITATAIKHLRRIESAVTSGDRKLQEATSDLAVEAVWTLSEAHGFDSAEN